MSDPLTPIIENVFSHELHSDGWKAYTRDSLVSLLKTKVKESGMKLTDKQFVSLRGKLGRCKDVEAMLEVLTDVAFGKLAEDNE